MSLNKHIIEVQTRGADKSKKQINGVSNGLKNMAKQAAIAAGIPVEKTAYVINQVCGSGLRSIAAG